MRRRGRPVQRHDGRETRQAQNELPPARDEPFKADLRVRRDLAQPLRLWRRVEHPEVKAFAVRLPLVVRGYLRGPHRLTRREVRGRKRDSHGQPFDPDRKRPTPFTDAEAAMNDARRNLGEGMPCQEHVHVGLAGNEIKRRGERILERRPPELAAAIMKLRLNNDNKARRIPRPFGEADGQPRRIRRLTRLGLSNDDPGDHALPSSRKPARAACPRRRSPAPSARIADVDPPRKEHLPHALPKGCVR
jgi:hypothetical protein